MSENARLTIARWLPTLGGLLCLLSYVVPWVAGPAANYGEGYSVPPLEYGYVWSGHRSLENDLWPAIPYSVSTTLTLLLAALPLLMALTAVGMGTVALLRGTERMRGVAAWTYWTAAVMGVAGFLVMTYALDPWNLRGTAWQAGEWRAPPWPEPGIILGYAGVLGIIVGGILLRGERETLAGRRTRAGETTAVQ